MQVVRVSGLPDWGTIFEKTTTPLSDWFYTIYLMTATRSGVSAKEVERQLGVTYKTAWRICHQIRKLMADHSTDKLKGHIEIDETYIGGVHSGKRGRGARGKSIVFGVVERGGRIKAMPVDDVKRTTLIPQINAAIKKGSRISTDEMHTYKTLKYHGYDHAHVLHSAHQYVAGDVHVQNTEGFWARLKLSIREPTYGYLGGTLASTLTSSLSATITAKPPTLCLTRLCRGYSLPQSDLKSSR